MTQYNFLNIKLPNFQINKLKSVIKNGTEDNDANNFPHKLLLTNTQDSKLRKCFPNGSSANHQKLNGIKQDNQRDFQSRLLGSLLKTGLSLIGNVLNPFAKSALIPLGLAAVASATDEAIHRKMFGSGSTTLIISNEEMNNIMETIKSLEESNKTSQRNN